MGSLKIILYLIISCSSVLPIKAQLKSLTLISLDNNCGISFELNNNKLEMKNNTEHVLISMDTIFYTDFSDTFYVYFDDSLVLELNSKKINLKSIKPGKTIVGNDMYFENAYDYIKLKNNGVSYFSFSSRRNYLVIGKFDCLISKALCFTINIDFKSGELVKNYNYGYYYTTQLDTNIKLITNLEIITYKSKNGKFIINNNSNKYIFKKDKLKQKKKRNRFNQLIPLNIYFN